MIQVMLQATDQDGELLEATVKLLAVPRKDETIEIDSETGTHILHVVDTPHHIPAIGMRDPQIAVPVDLRHERMTTLKEVMRCAHVLRTQDHPR